MASNPADLYLKVREKEGRLYADEIVVKLPAFPKNHSLSNEWQSRFESAKRLRKYLSQKNKSPYHAQTNIPAEDGEESAYEYLSQKKSSLNILDLGCGNGWLSNFLAQDNHTVIGVDQNSFELKQAQRVFSANPKVSFIDVDIFSAPFPKESFDIILLASAVQYFPDLSELMHTLLDYLKLKGEIHIVDSAFYAEDEIPQAIRRSESYYASLGFAEMSRYYFHHKISELQKFSPAWLYQPTFLRIKKIFGKIDSPFPWIVIRK